MNEHQLRCFLAVVQHKNFSKAARELFLAQPSLSYQISHLEKELGVPLFVRTTSSVQITEAGKIFEPYARSICTSHSQALAALRPYTKNAQTLTLQCPAVMVRRDPIYREIVHQFSLKFPSHQLNIITPDLSRTIEQSLADATSSVDCYITMRPSSIPEGFQVVPLFQTRFYAVAGPGHPHYAEDHLSKEQIQNDIFYYDSESVHFVNTIAELLRQQQTIIHLQETRSYEQIYPTLFSGKGLYISPMQYPVQSGEHHLRLDDLELPDTVLIYRCDKEKPSTIQFANLIQRIYANAIREKKLL